MGSRRTAFQATPSARSVDAAANARRISGLALRCKARSKRTGSRAGGCRGLPVLAAGLPVAPAITLALLAQPILVEARGAQLFAHFLARLSLAHLAIPTAITLTLLAQAILVFTGEPQLLALAAAAAAAAARSSSAKGWQSFLQTGYSGRYAEFAAQAGTDVLPVLTSCIRNRNRVEASHALRQEARSATETRYGRGREEPHERNRMDDAARAI